MLRRSSEYLSLSLPGKPEELDGVSAKQAKSNQLAAELYGTKLMALWFPVGSSTCDMPQLLCTTPLGLACAPDTIASLHGRCVSAAPPHCCIAAHRRTAAPLPRRTAASVPMSSILLHLCRYTTEMRLQKRQIWNQDLSPFGKLGDAGTAVMVDSTLQHVRFPQTDATPTQSP